MQPGLQICTPSSCEASQERPSAVLSLESLLIPPKSDHKVLPPVTPQNLAEKLATARATGSLALRKARGMLWSGDIAINPRQLPASFVFTTEGWQLTSAMPARAKGADVAEAEDSQDEGAFWEAARRARSALVERMSSRRQNPAHPEDQSKGMQEAMDERTEARENSERKVSEEIDKMVSRGAEEATKGDEHSVEEADSPEDARSGVPVLSFFHGEEHECSGEVQLACDPSSLRLPEMVQASQLENQHLASEFSCKICLELCQPGFLCVLPCSHIFCTQCLEEYIGWNESKSREDTDCPVCRAPLTPESLADSCQVCVRLLTCCWPKQRSDVFSQRDSRQSCLHRSWLIKRAGHATGRAHSAMQLPTSKIRVRFLQD
eukprot:TRINITY_DN14281_c0_g1_i1.p1 TRINITY_DN14281_c0_g1~~TRINITY_DN14281_c0_g1_i1.p1  ORF type:complete len:377 (-),score=57.48 TRINITY_DN14281_c0_g1_i1:1438-2568(-)